MDDGDLSADQRAELELTELTVTGRGMRRVGMPMEADGHQKDFATQAATGEKAAELLRTTTKIEDG